jgi:hypothetical protein
MTLPLSGNTINMSQVNTELTLPASSLINLGNPAVRALASKSSGTISMSDLWGKSFNNFVLGFTGPISADAVIAWYPDGHIILTSANGNITGAWGSPIGGNPGADYEIMLETPTTFQLTVKPYSDTRAWNTWYSLDTTAIIYTSPPPTGPGYDKFVVTIRHKTTLASISKPYFLVFG